LTGTDEGNLVICQIAKAVFDCPRTIARVNNPQNVSLFSSLGIDFPVSATRLIASMIQKQVKGEK
jgi:trk system potassium uptake protein TrkA